MKRGINSEEKCEIIAANSSDAAIMFSGALSSLALVLLGFIILLAASFFTSVFNFSPSNIMERGLFYFLFFIFAGTLIARLKKAEIIQDKKISYVYISLSLSMFFILLIETAKLSNANSPQIAVLLENLNFENESITSWSLISVAFLVLSFTMGNPLEVLWLNFYKMFLSLISSADYRKIYNKEHFYTQLKEIFYNAQRYQTSFSVAIFKLDNYSELKSHIGKRKLMNIHDELLDLLDSSIRKTDLSGFIEEGETYCVLLQATKSQAEMVNERILEKIKKIMSERYKDIAISLSSKTWGYSSEWKTVDDLIAEVTKNEENNPAVIRI